MKVHDIFEVAFFFVVEGAVEANPISMYECLDHFFVVIESLSAESDHDIWEVLLELRFHLHVETDRMHVPPVLSLPVVCHSQKMTLPVLEQFAPVLAETGIGIAATSALLEILLPGGVSQTLSTVDGSPGRYYSDRKCQQQASDEHFLCEDESCPKEAETVDFIGEVEEELAVRA